MKRIISLHPYGKAHRLEAGIALQTLIITAVLVLVAIVAGVLFLTLGRSTNEDFISQVPSTNLNKCNEVEVCYHDLAQRGIRGTNGHILHDRILNQNIERPVSDADIEEFRRENNLNASLIDLKPANYYVRNPNRNGLKQTEGEHWDGRITRRNTTWSGDLRVDIVGRLQGSAPGCVPVCFYQDLGPNTRDPAEAREFYYHYNTHPEPGIGPSPHHRGSLLATPTHLFIDFDTSRDQVRHVALNRLNLYQQLDFAPGIAGVRVGADYKSCEAYDAEGNAVITPSADPEPYSLADRGTGFNPPNFVSCPAGSHAKCKGYRTSNYDQILAQGYLGGVPGFVCADESGVAGGRNNPSQYPPCYIFPYTHKR